VEIPGIITSSGSGPAEPIGSAQYGGYSEKVYPPHWLLIAPANFSRTEIAPLVKLNNGRTGARDFENRVPKRTSNTIA